MCVCVAKEKWRNGPFWVSGRAAACSLWEDSESMWLCPSVSLPNCCSSKATVRVMALCLPLQSAGLPLLWEIWLECYSQQLLAFSTATGTSCWRQWKRVNGNVVFSFSPGVLWKSFINGSEHKRPLLVWKPFQHHVLGFVFGVWLIHSSMLLDLG